MLSENPTNLHNSDFKEFALKYNVYFKNKFTES